MRSASRSRLGKSHCKTNLHLSCLVSVNIRNALMIAESEQKGKCHDIFHFVSY